MVSVVSTKFKLLTSGKSKLWIAIVMLSISFLVIMPAGDFCFRVQKSVDASHKEMRVILKMRQDGTNKPSRYNYSKSTGCFNKSKDDVHSLYPLFVQSFACWQNHKTCQTKTTGY